MKSPYIPQNRKHLMKRTIMQVVTVREAADMFCRTTHTIRWHIDRGNLVYRQTRDGKYIISLDSLISLYGLPLKTLPE